jgi:hypothetical protein
MQVFYNKNGAIKYARARHYLGQIEGKPQFEYHQQVMDYLQRKLGELPKDNTVIGQVGHEVNVDLEKTELSSKNDCMAGGKGFEPLTLSLEG